MNYNSMCMCRPHEKKHVCIMHAYICTCKFERERQSRQKLTTCMHVHMYPNVQYSTVHIHIHIPIPTTMCHKITFPLSFNSIIDSEFNSDISLHSRRTIFTNIWLSNLYTFHFKPMHIMHVHVHVHPCKKYTHIQYMFTNL